jgi:tetratricopeptide (TPR) repeat protein
MPDSRRLDALPTPDGGVGRDSQAEALLVEGLDRYFSGRYEEAIHIWTRVLFVDRSHARAWAYIDRARTALAERQRRSEELLQTSQHLLDRGETGAARDLLTEAVASTGDDERASALRLRLERVERLERAHLSPRADRSSSPGSDVVPGWSWPRRSPALVVVGAALVAGLLLVVGVTSLQVRDWMGFGSPAESLAGASTPAAVPVLSSSEVALVRARSLYARGRLAEALAALDRVDDRGPMRQAADALRVEIQRLLLAASRQAPSSPGPGAQGTGR